MAKTKLLKEDGIETKAGQTLHPDSGNASHAGDPKSRFEHLASIIGATHAMRDTELTKWWKEAAGLIGQEARNIPDGSSDRNSSTIDAKASDATVSKVSKHSYSEAMPSLKEAIKTDLNKIFETQEGLSDDFKAQAATLFEAAVMTLVKLKEEEMKEQMEVDFEEAFGKVVEELVEAVDDNLEEVANKWLEDNEVAIESSLRSGLAEDFLQGLRDLFAEHYIKVPEDQVDIVDSLALKVEELEEQLADAKDDNVELRKFVEQKQKEDIVETACNGLNLADSEKLVELAEAVDTDDLEEFEQKIKTIRESNFVKGNPKKSSQTLNESMEEVNEDNKPDAEKTYSSPQMRSYVQALQRTVRR